MKSMIETILMPVSRFIRNETLKRRVSHLLREKKEIFLEIGSGGRKGKNGWLTMDMSKNCDICWDLRKGIPFPDGTVSRIYSSHFLEHLSFKEGREFLDECLRVLVPEGVFLICVPNARIYIESYLMNVNLENHIYLSYTQAYNGTTKIDYVNYIAYMDGHHKYMFDEENLVFILKSKGFRNVRLREFDPTIDLKEREFQSIYAECKK